jgi:hypothetical protein
VICVVIKHAHRTPWYKEKARRWFGKVTKAHKQVRAQHILTCADDSDIFFFFVIETSASNTEMS